MRCALARGEREPQERAAHEEFRRHQVAVHPIGEHEDVKADETHVVRQRHPRDADVVFGEVRHLGRAAGVCENVVMRQHDALGLAGGAGGELDEGDVIRLRAHRAAGARDVVELVDDKGARAQRCEELLLAHALGEGGDALKGFAVGVEVGTAELSRDAQQFVAMLVADAKRHRHRNNAAQHRGPEGIDERFIAAEEQDELVAAARAEALQVMQDAQGALVELRRRTRCAPRRHLPDR